MTRQGDAFEQLLLGEVATLDETAIQEASGIDRVRARALWQALGFPVVPDDMVAFTQADVDALVRSRRLLEAGLVDEDRLLLFARVMGQALARLAEEQVAVMGDVLAAEPQLARMVAEAPEAAAEAIAVIWSGIVTEIEHLQSYVWRRHLLASGQRLLASVRSDTTGAPVVVGFADIVGYTERTRELSVDQVEGFVEGFERTVYDAVVDHGARVIKTLGDEVMFVADEPLVAAEVGLALAAAELPMHVGMAYGQVLHRGGDLFGPVVNIAARCASIAKPGTVVVDRELAAELADNPAVELKSMTARKVRGYERLHVSVLRRAHA